MTLPEEWEQLKTELRRDAERLAARATARRSTTGSTPT